MKLLLGVAFLPLLLVGGVAQTPALGARVSGQALTAKVGYSIAQVQAAGGVTVREYVAPSGEIFGIAWQGPRMPDLSQWLGARFAAFQAAAQSSRRHGPLYVQVGTLVVVNSGHMRSFHGRAYLTDAIPATLSPAVVQ